VGDALLTWQPYSVIADPALSLVDMGGGPAIAPMIADRWFYTKP
jgi:hypothetical protein